MIVKEIEYKQKLIKLHIYDTCGQELFASMLSSVYRFADGVIIVYDITSNESFNKIDFWLDQVKKYCCNPVITLVGSKNDKTDERQVYRGKGARWAMNKNFEFFEVSAKNEEDLIECIFEKMVREIMEKKRQN